MSWYLGRLPRSHQLARVLSYLRLGTATLTLIRLRFACLLAAAAFSKIQDRYYYELRLVGSNPFTMCPTGERVLLDKHIPAVRCYNTGAESSLRKLLHST